MNIRRQDAKLGDDKISRRTQVKPEKIYKDYNANNGDFGEIDAFNSVMEDLVSRGFLAVDRENFGTQINNKRCSKT